MPFLTQPIARLAAIIEGAYPATPITGRSVPAGRHKPTLLHGDLRDPEFPAAHFHRGYTLEVIESGDIERDPPNVRAGSQRKYALVRVDLGYLHARDAARVVAGSAGALMAPSVLGHSDHETIAQALRYSVFWSGTSPTIEGLTPSRSVSTEIVVRQSRIIVSATWRMVLSYAPGTDWS